MLPYTVTLASEGVFRESPIYYQKLKSTFPGVHWNPVTATKIVKKTHTIKNQVFFFHHPTSSLLDPSTDCWVRLVVFGFYHFQPAFKAATVQAIPARLRGANSDLRGLSECFSCVPNKEKKKMERTYSISCSGEVRENSRIDRV